MIRNEKYEIRCHSTTATSDVKIKKPEKRDNLRALLSVGKCSLDFFLYRGKKGIRVSILCILEFC